MKNKYLMVGGIVYILLGFYGMFLASEVIPVLTGATTAMFGILIIHSTKDKKR